MVFGSLSFSCIYQKRNNDTHDVGQVGDIGADVLPIAVEGPAADAPDANILFFQGGGQAGAGGSVNTEYGVHSVSFFIKRKYRV